MWYPWVSSNWQLSLEQFEYFDPGTWNLLFRIVFILTVLVWGTIFLRWLLLLFM